MVKETEANLPVDWSFVGGNGGNGSNPELAAVMNRLVLIDSVVAAGKGFGYIYGEDMDYLYVATHSSFIEANKKTIDFKFANGTAGTALVIGANKTQGVGVLALMRPGDYRPVPDGVANTHVITGDYLDLVTLNGSVRAQVLEPYWGAKYPKGILEVRDVGMALMGRLNLLCSKQLVGSPCLTKTGDLTGFVSGRDQETKCAVMVKRGGFYRFLDETRVEFPNFMNDKGYKLEELFSDYEKYHDMRLSLSGIGAQTFFGINNIMQQGVIHVIDVPTMVNAQRGMWLQPSYIAGTEVLVPTPANSNLDFMRDFNRYKSIASCTLKALRWAEPKTVLVVEMSEGHPAWPVALDIVAAARLSSFTAKMQWDFADGRPPKTTEYTFDLKKLVEEKTQNGTTIIRPISQLSSLVTNLGPRFVRWQVGTTITSIDEFAAGQNLRLSRPGHGVVGDYRYYYDIEPARHVGGFADFYRAAALTEYANTGVYPGGVNLAHWHDYLGVGDRVRGDRFHNFALNYWGNN